MTLSPSSIATAIAGLSPIDTNITVKDLDGILDKITKRSTPLMMPLGRFITDPKFTPKSTGTGLNRKTDFTYVMNYRFYFQPIGTNRKLAHVYQDLVDKSLNIVEAIITNDSLGTAVDISPATISAFGVVFDPSDNRFFGCDLGFTILEFMT